MGTTRAIFKVVLAPDEVLVMATDDLKDEVGEERMRRNVLEALADLCGSEVFQFPTSPCHREEGLRLLALYGNGGLFGLRVCSDLSCCHGTPGASV